MTAWWTCPTCDDPVEADDGLDVDTPDDQPCDLCVEAAADLARQTRPEDRLPPPCS